MAKTEICDAVFHGEGDLNLRCELASGHDGPHRDGNHGVGVVSLTRAR